MSITNKTVNEKTIVSPNVGDIIYFNGTDWVRLAAGPNGYALVSNGTGTNPSYQAVSGGGGGSSVVELSGYGLIQSGLAEVNQQVYPARFKAEYNFSTVSVVLDDDDGNATKDVSATPGSFSSDGYFQKTTFGNSVTFTLTADGYTDTFSVIWGQRNFFGTGAGGNTAAFILDLASIVNSSVETLFSVNAGATDKIYFAHRTGYGTPTIYVDGFEGGFTVVSTTISITNPYGFTEDYTLWESDNVDLGVTTVEVL